MKGGPSINVLLDLALGSDKKISKEALNILKTQVFLYEAEMNRIKKAYLKGNKVAKQLLKVMLKLNSLQNYQNFQKKLML